MADCIYLLAQIWKRGILVIICDSQIAANQKASYDATSVVVKFDSKKKTFDLL